MKKPPQKRPSGQKLSEIFPKLREIKLMNGKIAKIGLMTLAHTIEIEEQYGSMEHMMANVRGSFKALVEIVWMLVINKNDLGSFEDFVANVPAADCAPLEVVLWSLKMSHPDADPKTKGKAPGN